MTNPRPSLLDLHPVEALLALLLISVAALHRLFQGQVGAALAPAFAQLDPTLTEITRGFPPTGCHARRNCLTSPASPPSPTCAAWPVSVACPRLGGGRSTRPAALISSPPSWAYDPPPLRPATRWAVVDAARV